MTECDPTAKTIKVWKVTLLGPDGSLVQEYYSDDKPEVLSLNRCKVNDRKFGTAIEIQGAYTAPEFVEIPADLPAATPLKRRGS